MAPRGVAPWGTAGRRAWGAGVGHGTMVFGRRDADGALQAETENPLGGWQELDEGPELGTLAFSAFALTPASLVWQCYNRYNERTWDFHT